MYLNILNPFGKRFTAHQECSQKFLQKKGGKSIPFLDESIPCLEGRRGGSKGLNEKNLPHVLFKFPVPPSLGDHFVGCLKALGCDILGPLQI